MKIAFCGNKETGKTTLSKILVDEYKYTKVSFAEGVYRLGAHTIATLVQHDLQEHEVYDMLRDGRIPKEGKCVIAGREFPDNFVRYLLQGVGNGCRDHVNDQVWIDKFIQDTADLNNLAIDDGRYLNEIAMLYYNDYIIIHIDKPDSDTSHGSEQVQNNMSTFMSQHGYKYDDTKLIKLPYTNGKEANEKFIRDLINNE